MHMHLPMMSVAFANKIADMAGKHHQDVKLRSESLTCTYSNTTPTLPSLHSCIQVNKWKSDGCRDGKSKQDTQQGRDCIWLQATTIPL